MGQNSTTQIVTNLKYSNCERKNLKNFNCDQTQKLIVTKLKTQIGTKLKLWQISNTQMVTNLKYSNCDKTQNFATQNFKLWQLKLWQYSNWDKTQIVTKLKLWQNLNHEETKQNHCDKSEFMTKLNWRQNSIDDKMSKESLCENYLTLWQAMRCSLGSFSQSRDVLI